VRTASPDEHIRVSRATATAVRRLNAAPVPTVALVQGGCFGGGTGIIAACDVVIAADTAMFSIAGARKAGLEAGDEGPAEFGARIKREIARWISLGAELGVTKNKL
jgi:methylglutaconyl-CoA hydratase